MEICCIVTLIPVVLFLSLSELHDFERTAFIGMKFCTSTWGGWGYLKNNKI